MRKLITLWCVALLGGCGAETGIVVVVAGSQAIDELEFQVGIASGAEFILDTSASGHRPSVRGRNLQSSPYELLLREEGAAAEPPQVRVLVVAYTAGKVAALGVTDPPQSFIRGELLRRRVQLVSVPTTGSGPPTLSVLGQSCYRLTLAAQQGGSTVNKTYKIHTANDADCDGYTVDGQPPDCDDHDETRHPGAKEGCDGKDNNCDGVYAPENQICYARDTAQVCREGGRVCHDQPPGTGFTGPCVAQDGGKRMAEAYCRGYESCAKWSLTPLDCAASSVRTTTRECAVAAPAGIVCATTLALKPQGTATPCHWEIVDSGAWAIEVTNPDVCEATLTLRAENAGTTPILLEFFYGGGSSRSSSVVQIKLAATTSAADCNATPLITCK
jgi:hypothetical protein